MRRIKVLSRYGQLVSAVGAEQQIQIQPSETWSLRKGMTRRWGLFDELLVWFLWLEAVPMNNSLIAQGAKTALIPRYADISSLSCSH